MPAKSTGTVLRSSHVAHRPAMSMWVCVCAARSLVVGEGGREGGHGGFFPVGDEHELEGALRGRGLVAAEEPAADELDDLALLEGRQRGLHQHGHRARRVGVQKVHKVLVLFELGLGDEVVELLYDGRHEVPGLGHPVELLFDLLHRGLGLPHALEARHLARVLRVVREDLGHLHDPPHEEDHPVPDLTQLRVLRLDEDLVAYPHRARGRGGVRGHRRDRPRGRVQPHHRGHVAA
mmetsp:Transcript_10802/g.25261  ORF Transcript_10802/g.25261 Transcript_10802/m.25261 type:complete len:235 (-) Transcript_10802:1120-1824(-)